MQKSGDIEAYASVLTQRRENVKLIVANCKDRFQLQIVIINYNHLYPNVRSSHRSFSVKKVFLKVSQNSQKNTCIRVSFLIKFQTLGNFIEKEALALVFSYEIWKIFMDTFLQNISRGYFLNFHLNNLLLGSHYPLIIF